MKNGGWEITLLFGRYVLRGYVSFGEGKQHLDLRHENAEGKVPKIFSHMVV